LTVSRELLKRQVYWILSDGLASTSHSTLAASRLPTPCTVSWPGRHTGATESTKKNDTFLYIYVQIIIGTGCSLKWKGLSRKKFN